MSEAKKKAVKLGQDKMEDVKGGIPYEDPGIIPLDDGTVTVTPATGDDPAPATTKPKGCSTGYRDVNSCLPGDGAVNACGRGNSVNYT